MAPRKSANFLCYIGCAIFFALLSSVSCLSLQNVATTKPKHSKYTQATPEPPGVTPGSASTTTTAKPGVAVYRIQDSKGATCILLKTDALIEIIFKEHFGEERGDTYIPDNPLIEGNCKGEDQATMRLNWNGYSLLLYFEKTPGGERWYMSRVELMVNTKLTKFSNIRTRANYLRLVHSTMVMPTPVGKSYSCEETVIELAPLEEDQPPPGLRGTLFLRDLQVQPFMYKGDDFGPAFSCSLQKSFRDETAPIAVGSTLAIAVLLTVAGYGVWRYFRIEKVKYSTME